MTEAETCSINTSSSTAWPQETRNRERANTSRYPVHTKHHGRGLPNAVHARQARGLHCIHGGSLGYQVIRLGFCRRGSQATPSSPETCVGCRHLGSTLSPSALTLALPPDTNIYQHGRPHSDCWAGMSHPPSGRLCGVRKGCWPRPLGHRPPSALALPHCGVQASP